MLAQPSPAGPHHLAFWSSLPWSLETPRSSRCRRWVGGHHGLVGEPCHAWSLHMLKAPRCSGAALRWSLCPLEAQRAFGTHGFCTLLCDLLLEFALSTQDPRTYTHFSVCTMVPSLDPCGDRGIGTGPLRVRAHVVLCLWSWSLKHEGDWAQRVGPPGAGDGGSGSQPAFGLKVR